jgi:predicted TIM-barrel fold metal-dependent hydrolase
MDHEPIHRSHLTRRFMLAAAAAGIASLAVRPHAAPAAELTAGNYPSGTFVDVHTHLGQTWNTTEPLSAADLLKWMDANDVAQAVVLPLVNPESSSFPLSTQFVLEQTKPHRDRLIPFCSIDPRTTINNGKKGVDGMLERYVELGCRGFGEHKPGLPIDDPLSVRLYAACGRHDLPVLFHLDNLRNTDKPGLPGLEAVLKANPQTTFIGHGPGFWASISGDVGRRPTSGRTPKARSPPAGRSTG